MATSLEETISIAAKTSAAPTLRDGDTRLVAIDLLDENPFQPRVKMDSGELDELVDSIASKGLLQSVVLRPKSDGRYIIVAGHRRVAAFRKLRDAEQGDRYQRISATIRLALDDAQLASMAYAENVTRSGLTAVEEGRALERMMDAGLATTNEQLAALTCQSLVKVRRLRRVAKAPKAIKDAIDTGLLVPVGKAEDGSVIEARRTLDLMAGLQLVSLHDHLSKTKPKQAEERVLGVVRRALSQNWSLRRTEDFVRDVLGGKDSNEGDEPRSSASEPAPIFERSPKRFTVDLGRLREASAVQREALRSAFQTMLAETACAESPVRNQQ